MTITTVDLHDQPHVRASASQRTTVLSWDAGEGVDHYGKPCRDVVTLTCMHSTGAKGFTASLRREQESDGVRSFAVFDFVTICRRPVARYSAKALDDFVEFALLYARDADAPKVQAILTGTPQ